MALEPCLFIFLLKSTFGHLLAKGFLYDDASNSETTSFHEFENKCTDRDEEDEYSPSGFYYSKDRESSDVETETGITESQEAARLTKLRFLGHHSALKLNVSAPQRYFRLSSLARKPKCKGDFFKKKAQDRSMKCPLNWSRLIPRFKKSTECPTECISAFVNHLL